MPRNVWALSWVAFFNDTATEMSYWLLPQFLIGVLGAGPMAFGLIEGAAETVSSFGRLLSGWLSDRLRRRKPLVAIGYTLANIVKPLLAVATSWWQVFWMRFADRAAKGFRGAPRDALLADSVSPAHRGAAFGLRQAMDTAGAVLGPLARLLCCPCFPATCARFFGWPRFRERSASCWSGSWWRRFVLREAAKHGLPPPVRPALRWNKSVVVMLIAVGLFSLGNSSDLFLILRAQNLGVRAALAPGLGLLFNVVYTSLSWPAGSSRIEFRGARWWSLAISSTRAVYLGFSLVRGPQFVWFLFAAYGMYYAMTEGVLRAWIADLVPSSSRGSVFGVFNWLVGVAALPASLLAGWLWRHYSPSAPFFISALLSFAAAILLLLA